MKKAIQWSVLALALALFATPALALIPCEDCHPDLPPGARCIGVCNGITVRYCYDWLNWGCPTWFATVEPQSRAEAEEAFIQSLRQADEPAAVE